MSLAPTRDWMVPPEQISISDFPLFRRFREQVITRVKSQAWMHGGVCAEFVRARGALLGLLPPPHSPQSMQHRCSAGSRKVRLMNSASSVRMVRLPWWKQVLT